MEKPAKFEDIRENEERLRKEQRATLEGLSGFSRLSEKQRKYILSSLYIQQRAERGTDPVSAERVQKTPSVFTGVPADQLFIESPSRSLVEDSVYMANEDRYRLSQENVMYNFCHRVIEKLERYHEGEATAPEWNYSGPTESYPDLQKLVRTSEAKSGFPLVIEIWEEEPKNDSSAGILHTNVLLGRNEKEEFLVWEKTGWRMPYRILPLSQSYEFWKWAKYWRLRPLSV